ncbi:uncharacterized protein LOC126680860 isoform X2 [Mercurialis annua]|uniref:uncharacterized protein LOC126680860 isoform X2 n=1 Tax=Mercurialis annua TaxID=3986 RepID=UPI00215F8973|nr:uncharacterized protein LOC126680860 isoform X2 [Mercurialis annua]
MASLGFRRPQFSEDLAWLPAWLQNPLTESSANQTKETLTNSSIDLEPFSREDCRNNNFKLHLSGDYDASQISTSPSPRNVVHFCLRLSLDGESQESKSHDLNMSQPLGQRTEASAGSLQERLCPSKAVGDVHLQSPSQNEEIGGRNGEHLCATPSSLTYCKDNLERRIKDADVNDAIELSIAASEALVIHELMGSASTSEVVSTGAILEAALQVKQARLEALEGVNCCSSDGIDEIDVLSDLDDSIMENALLDVGISFSDADDRRACDSDVSQVKDTPVDCHYDHNIGSKHVQQVVHCDNIPNDSALGLDNFKTGSLLGPLPNELTDATSQIPVVAKSPVDVTLSPDQISENCEEEEEKCSSVAHNFRSRWLGGWTVKGAEASANLKRRDTKCVPNFFDYETSFLSESAADANSFVQKCVTGSKIASQSSIPFEGVLNKADAGVSFFEEVRSSNQSLVDPLCSVVPCSISSAIANSLLTQNKDDREVDAKCSSTKSEFRIENFQRMSNISQESSCVNKEAMPTNTGEYCRAPVRRHLASLKTYSTLLPKHKNLLKGQKVDQNELLPSEHVGEWISLNGSFDQRNIKPLTYEFQNLVDRDHTQNQEINVSTCPVPNYDEPAKDAERQLQYSGKKRSPLVLNRRTRCRVQPSEHIVRNILADRQPEQIVAQGTLSNSLQGKAFQKRKYKSQSAHSPPNVLGKRVTFAEVEIELQQTNKSLKPQASQKNFSAIRANKRSKTSKMRSESRTQDVKSLFTGHTKDAKRLIFHGQQFLLTGFSSQKEREIVGLIQDHGGMVLLDVPSPPSNYRAKRNARSDFQHHPIIICPKKLQTTKFLYGCAVKALIVKVKWLSDSVAAGSAVPPEKYMILSNRSGLPYTRFGKLSHHGETKRTFDSIGIMLHGKHSFCTKLAIIIKHGGGQVFKTLQRLLQSLDTEKILIGAIVAEDESRASRHLRHYASERKIPMMLVFFCSLLAG